MGGSWFGHYLCIDPDSGGVSHVARRFDHGRRDTSGRICHFRFGLLLGGHCSDCYQR